MDWEQRCRELQQRIEELERENQEFRRQLGYAVPVQSVVTETPKNEMVLETAAGIPISLQTVLHQELEINCCDWRHSEILTSINLKLCGFLFMINHEFSVPRRSGMVIWRFPGAVNLI